MKDTSMKIRQLCFHLCLSVVALALFAVQVQGQVIVNDNFTDGDFSDGADPLDTAWYTSSSSSALDGGNLTTGQMDFITGTSGRGIHTIFAAQVLGIGDTLTASYTFNTPTTIDASGGNNSSFRVGLFNSLGQPGLAANVSASSGTPNAIYGWGTTNSPAGPGTQPLPGYMMDHDVYNVADIGSATAADLNFREHTQGPAPGGLYDLGTGRLMSTTGNFANIGSGPDVGYVWDPNSTYTGSVSLTRINATEFQLTGTLSGGGANLVNTSHTETDAFDSNTFDMFGFHANSNKFGSSSSGGDADNGLDFTNVTITFTPVPEPASAALLLGGLVPLCLVRRRK